MATSGDRYLATSGDLPMARDTARPVALYLPHWIGCIIGVPDPDRWCGQSRRGPGPIASTAGSVYRTANTQRCQTRPASRLACLTSGIDFRSHCALPHECNIIAL
jgi:hypothetical protein